MNRELLGYQQILSDCRLFRGLEEEALWEALEGLQARVTRFEKGQTIYRPGDAVRMTSVVLEGMVVSEANDAEGDKTNLNIMSEGDVFGAYLTIVGARSPMHVYAAADCAVLYADLGRLQEMDTSQEIVRQLYNNLVVSMAEKCVDLYSRVQIYSKKRIRSRIRMYLMSLEEKDGVVELPMSRTALAAYLGVDRTALARELTRMQGEGIIGVNKRRIRLLNREFFYPVARGGMLS